APPPSGPSRRRLYTWIVGGAGVAILAAALGTGLASHAAYNDLLAGCGPDHDACPPDFESERDLGQNLARATDGLIAVGAAAVVAGVVLFFVEGRAPRASARDRVTLLPSLLPGGGGLAAT